MPRILRLLKMCLMILAVATVAAAQTAGSFDKLSPGNQKIARALYEAQQTRTETSGSTSGTTSGSPSTASKTYSLDDIAAMKQSGKGWGVVFKEMKANGYYPDAKNLGQVVGNSTKAGKSGTGHGYGNGDRSGSSAGTGSSGPSSHGRGK